MSFSSDAPLAIKFDHVTKTYKLFENDRQRFMSVFWTPDKRKQITRIDASNDLSFEIRKGEAVAFLGRNGAGKSTALKMNHGSHLSHQGYRDGQWHGERPFGVDGPASTRSLRVARTYICADMPSVLITMKSPSWSPRWLISPIWACTSTSRCAPIPRA